MGAMMETKTVLNLSTIYFYITDGCNLRCRHCWITPDSAEKDMDTDAVKGRSSKPERWA